MRSQTRATLSILFASSVFAGGVAACSGDDNQPVTPVDAGHDAPAPKDDGGPLADGGDAGDSGDSATDGGADADASTGPHKSGSINISQNASGNAFSTAIHAGFSASAAGETLSEGCTSATISGCQVITCLIAPKDGGTDAAVDSGGPSNPPDAAADATADAGSDAADAGSDAGPSAPNAGEITISGGAIAAPGIVLKVDNGKYTAFTGTTKLFSGGDTLTAKAGGADVPAFNETITTPADLALTAPVATGGFLSIDRTADLAVAWTGGGAGDVMAGAATFQKDVQAVVVTCTFKASDNKGTIPAAALGKLDKADGTTIIGLASFAPSSTKVFTSGDYSVSLNVSTDGASLPFKASK